LTNDTHPKEEAAGGIYNNVLRPHEIMDEPVNTLSSAAPESSTAALAGAVPKEEKATSDESVPGAFPLTPPAATPGSEPQAFSVNPIPATEGLGNPIKLAPGEKVPDASAFTSNTVQSTVKDDTEPAQVETTAVTDKKDVDEAKVSVAPIPATAGPGNPIHLEPGEKVPDASTLTSNTISSTATTDEKSYNMPGALPPQLGPVLVTPEAEREAKGGMFALPPLSGPVIPESSLPMGAGAENEKEPGFTIQSAAPTSTTAALAGAVPKEPRGVPAAVTESQKEAHYPPEASANPEAVQDKKEVEHELKEKIAEQPATTGNTSTPQDTVSSQVTDAAATGVIVGANVAANAATTGVNAATTGAHLAKEKAAQAVGVSPDAPVTEVAKTAAEQVIAAAYSAKERIAEAVGLNPHDTAADAANVASNAATSGAYTAKDKAAEAASVTANTVTSGAVTAKDKAAEAATVTANTVTSAAYTAKDKVAEAATVTANTVTGGAYAAKDAATDAAATTASTVTGGAYAAKEKATEAVGANGQVTASDVPDVVAESQKEAHASPEASANAEAVQEKKQVEAELLKEFGKGNEASAVPEVVTESQKEAHASPEASANPEAVEEKKEVESELLREVTKTDEAGEPAPTLTAAVTETAPGSSTGAGLLRPQATSAVPDVVAESQKEAHASPEASANEGAVADKQQVESELLKEITKTNETGEPAPTHSTATGIMAPAGTTPHVGGQIPASDVPAIVAESQKEAHASPEAAASTHAVADKKEVESELLKEVWKTEEPGEPAPKISTPDAIANPQPLEFTPITATGADADTKPTTSATVSDGLNAPASKPAQPLTAIPVTESRDVSPMTKQPTAEQTQPVVTTGTETTTTEAKTEASTARKAETPAAPETPHRASASSAQGTPESVGSSAAGTDKKKKRHSIFGKLKAKLKDL
jgi:hypothetical protein